MDVQSALSLANAACKNARALEQDARSLVERRSFGRATALAIIGLEECGKARTLAQNAIGEWRTGSAGLSKSLRDHEFKQMSGALPRELFSELLNTLDREKLAAALRPILERLGNNPESFDPVELRASVERVLVELSAPHTQQLEELGARIREEMKRSREQIVDQRELQHLKHLGLYVDWDASLGLPTEPSSITQVVCEEQLARLSVLLAETEQYLELLGTPENVQALRAMLGRLRSRDTQGE